MKILAKKMALENGAFKTQNLSEHTKQVIEEALKLIDEKSLEKITKNTKSINWPKDKIKDLIFFACYFHDIGKATREFQATINNDKKSFHSLYSFYVLDQIDDFKIYEESPYEYVNLLSVLCLTHHTLLPYNINDCDCNFLEEAKDFFNNYKNTYEKYFKKECKYKFDFKLPSKKISRLKENLQESLEDEDEYINKFELRNLYIYCSGILNLADWLASARFSGNYPNINFDDIPTKANFMENINFKLRDFQENLSSSKESVLVEIPTGEGKTEGSLLWAIKNLYNENTKIIYTLPTQVTSNKLFNRIADFFDKSECGLIHSNAKFYLEKDYLKENGIIDEKFKSNFLLNKNFSKPVTVSTIDSLLKFFINIGRFNIATKNFINSTIIIDEIHCYDFKLLGFIKRFLELCDEFDIKVCIMSASIPNKIKEKLDLKRYKLINQNNLLSKKANIIKKIDNTLDNNLDLIPEKFKENKNILVIRNTVKSAVNTYKSLIENGINKEDIMLYHSTFKKKDKIKKEEEIFSRLGQKKPFILVATQIVEVSLDIDFDVMFSDNAPIDALIQRFGRVNRKKDLDNIGEIYIFKYEYKYPYESQYLLKKTFEVIEEGCFSLAKYTQWLNLVYDEIFTKDIKTQNELEDFEKGYKKYNKTINILHGIEKSADNYDLRNIKLSKNDYLLFDDFINDNVDYENTISLPIYLEKDNIYEPEEEQNYKILNLSYDYEIGIIADEDNIGLNELGE